MLGALTRQRIIYMVGFELPTSWFPGSDANHYTMLLLLLGLLRFHEKVCILINKLDNLEPINEI
jgi:hypothetical protein